MNKEEKRKNDKALNPENFKSYLDRIDSQYYPEMIGIILDRLSLKELSTISIVVNEIIKFKKLGE